jgi:hypothetical protein
MRSDSSTRDRCACRLLANIWPGFAHKLRHVPDAWPEPLETFHLTLHSLYWSCTVARDTFEGLVPQTHLQTCATQPIRPPAACSDGRQPYSPLTSNRRTCVNCYESRNDSYCWTSLNRPAITTLDRIGLEFQPCFADCRRQQLFY